jgi:RNA polymerase-binding transcription factor DksA
MAKVKEKTSVKAKAKKPAAKAKSKPATKPKKAAAPKKKAAKKVVAKKAVKKVVAKKPAAKKEAPKKVVAQKAQVQKEAPVKKIKHQKIKKSKSTTPVKAVSVKTVVEQSKPTTLLNLGQITMFQMPTQRPIAHKPTKVVTEDRSRYSEEELKEFEALILGKLEKSREEYKILKETLNRNNDEGTDATSGGNTKVLEDGAETAEKENLSQLAARQQKYITNLENALVRIKNGTYGICSVTGKLISKERLIAVPHTTQSIEAKMMQQD